MNQIKPVVGLIILLFGTILPGVSAPQNKPKRLDIPSGLTVEYIREPKNVAINDPLPEYCWIVPKEAVFQQGYQILVASSKTNIRKNVGDVWDSGQVRSSQSVTIEHEGNLLNPDSKYFWKVRIWDQNNRPSDYSAVQEFKTGSFSGTISTGNAFQIERIRPQSILKTAPNNYLVDFGKDAFGTLELNYSSSKPDTIIVRLGEKLNGKSIDRKPGGTIRYSEMKLFVQPGRNMYTLKLKPDVRNTLKDKAVLLPDSFDVITSTRIQCRASTKFLSSAKWISPKDNTPSASLTMHLTALVAW